MDSTANLVTLTIGGNDAGFGDVVQTCIIQKLKADAKNAVIGPVGQWLGLGSDPSCAHSSTFVNSSLARVGTAGAVAQSAYTALAGQVDPTNTSVLAADYPKLFPTSSSEQNCVQLSPFLTSDD